MEDGKLHDRSAAAKNANRMWIFLGVMLIVLMVAIYSPSSTITNTARPLTDAEKCAGLSGPDCLEKLSLERRRREFVESPEGQEFLRAAEAVEATDRN